MAARESRLRDQSVAQTRMTKRKEAPSGFEPMKECVRRAAERVRAASYSGAPRLEGFTPDVAKNVMARACMAAGIPHFHPHDLRHQYASVKMREGVPVTDLAAQLRQSKKSLTLDTYSHVLVD